MRYMDRKELITMWENQDPTPAPEQVAPKPTYEELERAIENLNRIIEADKAMTESRRAALINWEYKAEKLEEWIEDEGDSLTERQIEEICDIFGWDTEITKTVRVEIEFEVEITAKRGFDFDDIDGTEFDVDISRSGTEWSARMTDWSVNDLRVD